MGIIIGTAAMAPEQARGKSVDKRADVWASVPCVSKCSSAARRLPATPSRTSSQRSSRASLTGQQSRRPRPRRSTSCWRGVSKRTPNDGCATSATPSVRARKHSAPVQCVRDDRCFGAADWCRHAGTSLGWIAATAVCGGRAALCRDLLARRSRPAATTSNWPSRRRPERSSRWINLGNVIVSPDGTKVAFVAATPKATTLWVRSLAVDDGRSISGTEGADGPGSLTANASASPRTRLRIVDIGGGLPEAIADARWPRRLMDGGRLDPLHADRRHHGSQGRGDWRRRDATHEARHDTRRKRALLAGCPAGGCLPLLRSEAHASRTAGSISRASTAERPVVSWGRSRGSWLAGHRPASRTTAVGPRWGSAGAAFRHRRRRAARRRRPPSRRDTGRGEPAPDVRQRLAHLRRLGHGDRGQGRLRALQP